MSQNPFLIGDEEGFTPHMGCLVGMMRYARKTTLDTVQGLSTAQLDHLHDPFSNTIGSLLLHIAAVEAWYQANTFDEREWTATEQERLGVALGLGEAARTKIRGHSLEYYLDVLEAVRARTLDECRQRDDAWLAIERPFVGKQVNNHFKWFHVFEDEINHRGQMRWLRKRLLGMAGQEVAR